jgi:hypothetical protein
MLISQIWVKVLFFSKLPVSLKVVVEIFEEVNWIKH